MKTAIVTGSGGNLGQAIVRKFLAEGYRVIGTVTHEGSYKNDQFEEHIVDVSNEEQSRLFVERVVSKHGSIDVAILTVGGFAQGGIADTGVDDMKKQYDLNFITAYNIARPVFLQMSQQKSGRIFLTGSRPGIDAAAAKPLAAYALAKSLLFRLAEIMNEEGSEQNVVTSVVVPGIIDTPINRKFMTGADFNSWVKASDIAEVIHFYCTEPAAALREPIIKVYNNS